MLQITLEAPWYSFQKKVSSLFKGDPDIIVSEVYEVEGEDYQYAFDIEIRKHDKYVAMDRVMPAIKSFGNVKMAIMLFDEENANGNPDAEVYETIFRDNPILEGIKDIIDPAGIHHGYVVFKPEVIQFFDDELSSYNGKWSGLAQDIAREIFDNEFRGVHFCTADVDGVDGADKANEANNAVEASKPDKKDKTGTSK